MRYRDKEQWGMKPGQRIVGTHRYVAKMSPETLQKEIQWIRKGEPFWLPFLWTLIILGIWIMILCWFR